MRSTAGFLASVSDSESLERDSYLLDLGNDPKDFTVLRPASDLWILVNLKTASVGVKNSVYPLPRDKNFT